MLPAKTRRNIESPRRVSLEDYFKAEEKALHKNEYHNGIVKPMAGAKFNHNVLVSKAITLINVFIEDNNFDYIVNNSDIKVRIDQYDKVVYPDAVVICKKPEYFQNREDTIINPLLVVEVLSKSTANFDRTTKYEMYRTLPSFKEYVLIHQDRKHVSVYTKQPDATWIIRDYDGDDATAVLYAIEQCPLSLKRLYRGLEV